MLTGSRLHHFALKGCLAFGLHLALGLHVFAQAVGDNAAQPRAEKAQEHPTAEKPPTTLEAIQRAVERIGTALETQNDKEVAERKEKHEAEDLKAQWDQAKWAKWMTYVAGGGLVLTFVGLLMIYGTLRYTKDAADSARGMLAESIKATAAAEATFNEARRANEISREGLIAQHRPWMTIEVGGAGPVRISHPGSVRLNINFTAKNIGNRPAFRTMYDVKAFWTQRDWPKAEHIEALIKQTIGQQRRMSAYAPIVVPKDDTGFGFVEITAEKVHPKQDASKSKEFGIVVLCCVAYQSDLSDKWFHTVQTAYVRYKRPPDVHPRHQRRFTWTDVEIPRDDIDVSISKNGGSSSIA